MANGRFKEIVPPLCAAVFMFVCSIGFLMAYDYVLRRFEAIVAGREGYTMLAFVAALLAVSFVVHAAVATMNSKRSLRAYLKPSAFLNLALILPGGLLGGQVLFGMGNVIGVPLVIGVFGWWGFNLLRSPSFATATGPRSRQWALATMAIGMVVGFGTAVFFAAWVFTGL